MDGEHIVMQSVSLIFSERLDELIGHAEPEQAMSQFQVHCRG